MMDMAAIKQVLPHRAPFLFVDGITGNDRNSADGYHVVTQGEFWVKGHFPGNPVFPGVILLECMAQVGGFVFAEEMDAGRFAYLTKVDNLKFSRRVSIGDRVEIHTELTNRFGDYAQIKAIAMVRGKRVASGSITYTFLEEL